MRFEDVDGNAPGEGMVRIAVRASAINYFDALMVAGQYQVKPDLPFVPGTEISGVVGQPPRAWGSTGGDRVSAPPNNGGLPRGGYAEIGDAHGDTAGAIADSMPFDEAPAFPLTYKTAWFGLHRRANLL